MKVPVMVRSRQIVALTRDEATEKNLGDSLTAQADQLRSPDALPVRVHP
jgi:hypothetical protein